MSFQSADPEDEESIKLYINGYDFSKEYQIDPTLNQIMDECLKLPEMSVNYFEKAYNRAINELLVKRAEEESIAMRNYEKNPTDSMLDQSDILC